MEIDVKKIGESMAKAFGGEAFFLIRVDSKKIGRALGCKPVFIELVNVILNQHGCEHIYEMVKNNKFTTVDESNMTGHYTSIPRTMEQLCESCDHIIGKALTSQKLSMKDIVNIVTARILLDGYVNKSEFVMDYQHNDLSSTKTG